MLMKTTETIQPVDPALTQLLAKMVADKQLSKNDEKVLLHRPTSPGSAPIQSEEDVLRWLAEEYDLAYTSLEDV